MTEEHGNAVIAIAASFPVLFCIYKNGLLFIMTQNMRQDQMFTASHRQEEGNEHL